MQIVPSHQIQATGQASQQLHSHGCDEKVPAWPSSHHPEAQSP